MTRFDKIKSMTIDEIVDWLDEYSRFDDAPWIWWWDNHYCNECEPEIVEYNNRNIECGWCELNGKCRFFKEMDDVPSSKQIMKMWLESENC